VPNCPKIPARMAKVIAVTIREIHDAKNSLLLFIWFIIYWFSC